MIGCLKAQMAARARAAMSLLDELDSDDDTTPAPPKAVPAPPAEPEPKQQGKEDSPASEVEVVTAGLAAAVVAAKEEEEEEAQAGGFKMTFGKKSKKQLQKEKKEAEARKRYEEAKESMKDWDDPKVAEDERLAMQLAPLSLKIKDIQPDGHCLYRALADQCMQNLPDLDADLAKEVATWEPGAGHTQMRKICARFMQQHADDFAPFVDTDDFGAYIDKIENTAEWGGDVELTALARRLRSHIHVFSAAMSEQTFSPEGSSSVHLRVTYHKHAFGLGEHYNSTAAAAR